MRIHIIGEPGSGKTNLGGKVAAILDCPHIELDAIYWQSNWNPKEAQKFSKQVLNALNESNSWVIDGNHEEVRHLVWEHVNLIVWLDYPLVISMFRLFRRTIRRITTAEDIWKTGNYETWRNQFLSRQSIFWESITFHRCRQADFTKSFDYLSRARPYIQLVRLTRPKEAQRWLNDLRNQYISQ